MTVRTRIAPSPTGEDIHIGNLYTAMINFAVARKNRGKFIIRIEDTDRERYVKGAEEKILTSLSLYGIENDEGPNVGGPHSPYRQSERLPIYKEYAEKLIDSGNAYYCTCSKERLDEIRRKQLESKKLPRYDRYCLGRQEDVIKEIEQETPYVVRLKVPENKEIIVKDLVRGEISFQSDLLDDQVLLKSDGYPTYHLGVVVDDHLMQISHVIRAEEWISSTPKHVLLYQAFGWELPVFAHLPILRNPDKSKLSKRKNPVWTSWYIEEGFLPEAVLNFLALLGWSHPEEKEIFSQKEFIDKFDVKDVHPAGPIFDMVKLTWMNQQYIQNLSDEELINRLINFYPHIEKEKELVSKLIPLIKTRMETLKDFEELTNHFFIDIERNSDQSELKGFLKERYSNLDSWTKDSIFSVLKVAMEKFSVRMPVFYSLFTGKDKGLPLPESLEILGKEKTLLRLD